MDDCECKNWCRDGRDMYSDHHNRCPKYTAPPTDPRFARFGEDVWHYIVRLGGDFFGCEISEDILPLAAKAGLCCRVPYDPELHGEGIEADPGDEIWWWGRQEERPDHSDEEHAPGTTRRQDARPIDRELVGVHPLVLRFLEGEWVRRFCGSGSRDDEMNWLHVRWQGATPYGKPVLFWGFGSAMTDERIVFDILQRPDEWESSPQNDQTEAREE